MDSPWLDFTMEDLARLLGEAGTHVLKILADVIMEANEHLLSISFRNRGNVRFFDRFPALFFFTLYVDGAGMGNLFHFGSAADGTGDLAFLGLLLIPLEAWKPPLKAVFFLADQVIDDHIRTISNL